jgi:hypothetical protein
MPDGAARGKSARSRSQGNRVKEQMLNPIRRPIPDFDATDSHYASLRSNERPWRRIGGAAKD